MPAGVWMSLLITSQEAFHVKKIFFQLQLQCYASFTCPAPGLDSYISYEAIAPIALVPI